MPSAPADAVTHSLRANTKTNVIVPLGGPPLADERCRNSCPKSSIPDIHFGERSNPGSFHPSIVDVACLSAVVFLASLLSACAPSRPRVELEAISPQQQLEESIDQTAPNFSITFDDDALAWERARMFFGRYTKQAVISELDKSGADLKIANSGMSDKYFYQVDRKLSGNSFDYVVRCIPNPQTSAANSFAAQRNARNLARFIKFGELELTLLDR